MNEEQFAAAIEGTVPQRDVVCRQVSNGFVLQGTVRYLEPTTQTVRLAQNFEGVAINADEAAKAVSDFVLTGSF